ncbi:RNA polymerase sigma factor [Aureisphaera galaxeae]|uniref:RNA polymerase sigma factor n=1 Tax=Aureisphaera galaxeae TaxID=1538023 RepID=UPI00234FD59F|nr:RNA polymerase sigma factor [Aureisphaera galaxeae]MDC8004405.1 RNA polymerase sigma factor [Aureisphaera galaxeae]
MSTSKKIIDALLVLKIQGGSQKAMALLVKRWHGKFCRHAYGYTKDLDEAKDIAQDSWKIILRKLNQLRDAGSFGSWGLSIVTRVSIDRIRKEKRNKEHLKLHYDTFNSNTDRGSSLVHDDRIKMLRKAMAELPENQKVTLQLFYLDGFSIKQIGDILQVPPGTVKSRLFKAREALKKTLKNKNHEK